jgi:hypothetical protein
LPASDLESLLLALSEARASAATPASVLREYRTNGFVAPSSCDPLALNELERLTFSLLPGRYEPVELSPLAPLGTTAALTPVHQDWVVTAGRRTEVLSDPTAVLSLECARRRRSSDEPVNLCASIRTVRAQPFEPPFRPHFRLIALASAGRDPGGHVFDTAALLEHIGFFVELATRCGKEQLRVLISPLAGGASAQKLDELVAEPLRRRFPDIPVDCEVGRQGGEPGYYVRTCFGVWEGDRDLADGGFTDWAARLLSNRKQRLLTSGIGTEQLLPR